MINWQLSKKVSADQYHMTVSQTLWHGTYLYSPHEGLPRGKKNTLQIMSLAAYASKTNNNKVEVEQGTFTPLVFTSTGGMADECKRFHSRLAELLALKKGDERRWLRYNHILDKGESILCHPTISRAVSQRNQEQEKSSQYIWHWHYIGKCASQNLSRNFLSVWIIIFK